MSERLRDPDLDRLVEELNRPLGDAGAEAGAPGTSPDPAPGEGIPLLDRPRQARVDPDEPLEALLVELVRRGGSDLHLVAGARPVARVDGRLVALEEDSLDGPRIRRLLATHLGTRAVRDLEARGATDLSLQLSPGREPAGSDGSGPNEVGRVGGVGGAWRFRVNLHRQRGELAAAIRALPREIPTLEGLHLPAALVELVRPAGGLVLVCGPTGAGKSSTLAALVGHLNRTRSCHVVTIEDPVEYEHRAASCLIEQIEVGRDTPSFADALRASLRQDPDVILVGEMRDLETVQIALVAAETGHLVLSTLHTHDSVQAIHRMVDVFPGAAQAQIRHQLAMSLHAVLTQQLVARDDGRGRLPAVELLLATPAVRNLIRSDQLQKLFNEITLGKGRGMISLEESLARLVRAGQVSREEAEARSLRPEELRSLLGGG